MSDNSLAVKLIVAARLMRKRFDHGADNLGVTRAQWSVILAVSRAPGATQRTIAGMLDVGEAAAGRLIDKLCEEGWLERRQDPKDRRSKRVHLQPAADEILEKLEIIGRQQEEKTFAGVTEEDRVILHRIMDQISANLGAGDWRDTADKRWLERGTFDMAKP